jgi:hypothetical protein
VGGDRIGKRVSKRRGREGEGKRGREAGRSGESHLRSLRSVARERAGEQDLESIYFKQTITQEQHLGALRLQNCEFAKMRI